MKKAASSGQRKRPRKVKTKLPVVVPEESDNRKTPRGGIADEVNAFVQLREDHARRRKAHRKQVRADVCSAYEFGLHLMENDDLWAMFREAGWKGIGCPQEDDQADAVRFAIKFMVGPGKDAQKKASFYFRAIKKFVEEGAPASDVKVALKKHGFRALTRKDDGATDEEGSKPSFEESDPREDRRSMARRKGEGSKNVAASASTKSGAAGTVVSAKINDTQGQRGDESNRRHPATLSLGWTTFECIVKLSAKALKLTRLVRAEGLEMSCTLIEGNPPRLCITSVREAEG